MIFYYCCQVFTLIGVDITDGRQWLTANSRWIFADDCLAIIHRRPIIHRLRYLRSYTTPNWVKLLLIYERDIGQAAGSLITRPSSPLSAMNCYCIIDSTPIIFNCVFLEGWYWVSLCSVLDNTLCVSHVLGGHWFLFGALIWCVIFQIQYIKLYNIHVFAEESIIRFFSSFSQWLKCCTSVILFVYDYSYSIYYSGCFYRNLALENLSFMIEVIGYLDVKKWKLNFNLFYNNYLLQSNN